MNEDRQKTPLRGVRKVIAQRMQESLKSTAQLTYHADADVTDLMEVRRHWKADGRHISLEDCLLFALTRTLRELTDFNGVADESSFTPSATVDMALAISSPNGLMTPVLRGIESLSLDDLARKRRDTVERALAGKLAVSEMKGGSFTLSNLGHTRVKYFTPILNAGQIGILGVGRMIQQLRLSEQQTPKSRSMLPLSLTTDHRIVDGDPSGRFLTLLCEQLEEFDDATSPSPKAQAV
tara:strand:- start:2981 stop:3691 length:711 start_codon:yes stop_codon:yes gene_type:complete